MTTTKKAEMDKEIDLSGIMPSQPAAGGGEGGGSELLGKILPYLLSGGGGALLGGLLTAAGPERRDETKRERRMRILRNALVGGTGMAGAHALLAHGAKDVLETAAPVGDVSPEQSAAHLMLAGWPAYGVAGAGTAAGVGAMAAKEEGKILNNIARQLGIPVVGDNFNTREALKDLLKGDKTGVESASPKGGAKVRRLAAGLDDVAQDTWRKGGINYPRLRNSVSVGTARELGEDARIAARRIFGGTVGQGGKRALLAAALFGIPLAAGHFMKGEEQ